MGRTAAGQRGSGAISCTIDFEVDIETTPKGIEVAVSNPLCLDASRQLTWAEMSARLLDIYVPPGGQVPEEDAEAVLQIVSGMERVANRLREACGQPKSGRKGASAGDKELADLRRRIAVHERFLHQLQLHAAVTMDGEKTRALVGNACARSYAHRVGNGELSPKQQQAAIDKAFNRLLDV